MLAIRINDVASFSRLFAQLDAFYSLPALQSSPSQLRPRLVSLLLLSHLSQNRIGQFHTVLERFDSSNDDVLKNGEVGYTVELEKALMEGSFAKIWRKRGEMPSQDYAGLLDTLMSTVRCVEAVSRGDVDWLTERRAGTRLHHAQRRPTLSFLSQTRQLCSSSAR